MKNNGLENVHGKFIECVETIFDIERILMHHHKNLGVEKFQGRDLKGLNL